MPNVNLDIELMRDDPELPSALAWLLVVIAATFGTARIEWQTDVMRRATRLQENTLLEHRAKLLRLGWLEFDEIAMMELMKKGSKRNIYRISATDGCRMKEPSEWTEGVQAIVGRVQRSQGS